MRTALVALFAVAVLVLFLARDRAEESSDVRVCHTETRHELPMPTLPAVTRDDFLQAQPHAVSSKARIPEVLPDTPKIRAYVDARTKANGAVGDRFAAYVYQQAIFSYIDRCAGDLGTGQVQFYLKFDADDDDDGNGFNRVDSVDPIDDEDTTTTQRFDAERRDKVISCVSEYVFAHDTTGNYYPTWGITVLFPLAEREWTVRAALGKTLEQ